MERSSTFQQREFKRALIPVMLSVLGGTVNTLIDSTFVSRNLDSSALAAISVNMPVFLALCMVGSLFGVGSFIASSHALGASKVGDAQAYYHSAILFSVLFSLGFMAVGFFFPTQVANFLTNDPSLTDMVTDYCRITLIGSLPYILVYIPTYFLQLSGRTKDLTTMTLIMVISDIILDWLFLFVFKWGIAGAALASVISTLAATVFGFLRLHLHDHIFRLRLRHFRLFGLKNIILFGSSAAIGNLMDVIRMFVLNMIIYSASGTQGLAIWAVVNSLLEISLCITTGIPRTAAPMLGIYIGGHDNEGVRSLVRLQIRLGLMLTFLFGLTAVVFHEPIGRFYKIRLDMLVPFICLGLSVLQEVLCSILGSYFNVAKRVFFSNFIMVIRTFVFPILFAQICYYFNLPVWFFLPVSMTVTLLVTVLIARSQSIMTRGKDHELSPILLLDDYLEKHNQVKAFSIVSSNEAICQASADVIDFCLENGMDRKTGTKLGLALEEVMTVMVQKSLNKENDPVDVRIFSYQSTFGISIMCSGKEYNLFKEALDNQEDEFNMGVQMIQKISKDCHYLYSLGMNILTVEF